MILFLDLDGTLTKTAHPYFKKMKDGIEPTNIEFIRKYVFPNAFDFIKEQIAFGNKLYIISDSHPKYVQPIAEKIFDLPYLSLADKPNDKKTRNFIESVPELKKAYSNKDNFIMIGDSWLDIELGRLLNIKTVHTRFYKTEAKEIRDGIGDDWKPMKAGPTYYTNSFKELSDIIANPLDNLLALEAVFQGKTSAKTVKFKFTKYQNGFTAFRCLARQEGGEYDRYARADKYYQIDKLSRSPEFLNLLANSMNNYLKELKKYNSYSWDYFTYVSDKKTTKPPNKMKEIFDLVESDIEKVKMLEWNKDVEGSLRQQPDYKSRREFIDKHLSIIETFDLEDKNVIIIDDQFTTSATAYSISNKLRNKGVKNIIFVALFYLILPLANKTCPKCGKTMQIKINRNKGTKFYSCTPPKYRGEGCGHIININNG